MLKRIVNGLRQRWLPGNQNVFPLDPPANHYVFPLNPPLPLPAGLDEQQLFDFVTRVRVQGAPEEEMRAYGTHDFKRFVYTWGLLKDSQGTCLELGSNPYFTTMLMHEFTRLNLILANYFGPAHAREGVQSVDYFPINTPEKSTTEFKYQHFNIEDETFPYNDQVFDIVVFAEIIEHLLNDPCRVLREIWRILKPRGELILTTPNVARLENVAKLIAGKNIYDPYSGYGAYGRHNREYTVEELKTLLEFEGYQISNWFTADVHANSSDVPTMIEPITDRLKQRERELGQYIFVKAIRQEHTTHKRKRPSWLYRSYPAEELV